MFVLAVGLLGLASMVPVGQVQVQQAANADAATALGRSEAFRLIKVRDIMDSESWVYLSAASTYAPADGEPFVDANGNGIRDGMPLETYTDTNGDGSYNGPASFMTTASQFIIDGLGLTNNAASTSYGNFPYGAATFPLSTVPTLQRVSLTDLGLGGGTSISAATADRIFRGMDDKNFALPADETQRPILANGPEPFKDLNFNGRWDATPAPAEPYTDRDGDGVWDAGTSPQGQSRGDYSWMVMVSPAVWWDTAPTPDVPHFVEGLGTTSVIVFHKRDPVIGGVPPSERVLWADIMALSAGSIDVQLRDTASASLAAARQVLKVRSNQWVMLSAQIAAVGSPVVTPAFPVHRWYRVVTVGDVEPLTAGGATAPWVCDVTLAGPDANFFIGAESRYADADGVAATGLVDASGDGITFICTICDGVIGVFEKTVQLDEPSLWTAH